MRVTENYLLSRSRLICSWCDRSQDQVRKLIAGAGVYICDQCVAQGAEFFSKPQGKPLLDAKPKCSFCGQRQSCLTAASVAGPGAQMCAQCIQLCEEILADGEPMPEDDQTAKQFEQEIAEPAAPSAEKSRSEAEKEWDRIDSETVPGIRLRKGRQWLKRYGSDELAGKVIAELLEIKATPGLVKSGRSWLQKFPNHRSAPALIGQMLAFEPTPDAIKAANRSFATFERFDDLVPLVGAIVKSSMTSKFYKELEDLLEQYPSEERWGYVLMTKSAQTHKKTDLLVAKWIGLNLSNPDLFVIPFVILAKSPNVIEAAFEWFKASGHQSKYAASGLCYIVRASAQHHKTILPAVLNHARRWLKSNTANAEAGQVHEAVIAATKAKSDVRNAKKWYEQNVNTRYAWRILATLLESAYWDSTEPDDWAVLNARALLKDPELRVKIPRLVGALVSACPDDETIAWAKDTYTRTLLLWILIQVLLCAPDRESLEAAEEAHDRWANSSLEPEMLYALLRADPQNARALRRARLWLDRTQRHRYRRAIKALVSKRKSQAAKRRRKD